MTTEEIQKRVDAVRADAEIYDSQGAHIEEDGLRRDFIRYVASLEDQPALSQKAKLVLTTEELRFERWVG